MTDKRFVFRRIWIGPEDTVQDWIPGKPSELDQLTKKLAAAAANFGDRGDSRSPEELRQSGGFRSVAPGSSVSLYDHVVNHTPSDYISTSRSEAAALIFSRPGGYVYEIEAPAGGINVNNELRSLNPTSFENEIAFKGEIPFDRIMRAWKLDEFWELDDELVVYTRDR
jgi:hypothetical protein